MNESLKQFSDELAKQLKEKIATQREFIERVEKSAEDDRTFEVVFSTSDEDRQGDALDQTGWDFTYFKMNPVVLFAHDYSSFPVGVATDVQIDGQKSTATGKFAPKGLNPEADIACALYQAGILKAVSPGYIQNDDGTRELLEISFCPVPAGRYALSLRQTRAVGFSTRELVTKGFFFKENTTETKSPRIGDSCQMDDGTPGVLAQNEDDPGQMVCVPVGDDKSKSNETQHNMDNELVKSLKDEHNRHEGAVAKHIDEFGQKCMKGEKAEGNDNSEYEKTIQEFTEKMDAECADHHEKCMKAIDDSYETMGREPNGDQKSIDEFKAAVRAEDEKHIQIFHKAIDEFKTAAPVDAGDDDKQKALDEFTQKSADELDRHEKAHMDMCKAEMGEGENDGKSAGKPETKGAVAEEMAEDQQRQEKYKRLDRAYGVFYAFTSAYLDDAAAVDDFEKLLDEAVSLMKNVDTKATGLLEKHMERQAFVNSKSTYQVIAALKELTGSPQGDEGKEQKPDEKSGAAPNSRSRSAGGSGTMSEFESFMFSRKLLRTVNIATGQGLEALNRVFKEKFPDRR